ncbi:META domain-containing protein [Demequina aurantiaca]|uniref:META domain-containing protein n=1 Tax=Demequina aurantiaca TaxID=676200 RepID=UPI003D32AF0A
MTTCSSSGSTAADPVGTWGETAEAAPQLVLAADGTLTGTDGCNRLMGEWTAAGDAVKFGPLASTRMFCEGVDTWLSAAATATIDANSMDVLDGTGSPIGTLDRQSN